MIPEMTKHRTGGYIHNEDPGEFGYEELRPRISVTDEEAKILAAMAAGLYVLEIGTGLGVATRAMAATARTIYTIDNDAWVHENIWPWLHGVVTLFTYPTRVVTDMVFIDGLHTEEAVLADIEQAVRLSPSLIVFHDMKLLAVQEAIREAGLTAVTIDTDYGIGIVRL